MAPDVGRLFVTWQEPESRRFFPIARLLGLAGGGYELAYIRAVTAARDNGFAGLPGFEELERVYVSTELPALFARRGGPGRRPSSEASVALGARGAELIDAAPIQIFVPREDGNSTRLEVFAPALPGTSADTYWGVFVARGVGRVPGGAEVITELQSNQPLALKAEPENPHNPRALLILRTDGIPLGYVPDYFANELALRSGGSAQLQLQVQRSRRLNFPPAPALYQVTCKYTCNAELGRALFRSDPYQPLSPDAHPS
jgi:hypothetical protein